MTSRQWRVIFGAVAFAGTTALAVAPELGIIIPPLVKLGLIVTVATVGYLKAPPDLEDPAA